MRTPGAQLPDQGGCRCATVEDPADAGVMFRDLTQRLDQRRQPGHSPAARSRDASQYGPVPWEVLPDGAVILPDVKFGRGFVRLSQW